MEKFQNKVAVVTGSSAGIGRAISKELVKHGVIVVGLARRLNKLQELKDELKISNYEIGKFYPMKCDVSKDTEIQSTFTRILSEIGPVHILVNNAAVGHSSFLTDVSGKHISETFDTNVKGALLCAKEAMKCMIDQSIRGHIININSMAGRSIHNLEPMSTMVYTCSKQALTVLSEALRREIVDKKLDIKVTNISPGFVRTKMSEQYIKEFNAKWFLEAEDIADACISVLNTPPNILISELSIKHVEVAD